MTTFQDILKKARSEARQTLNKSKDVSRLADVHNLDEQPINTHKEEINKTEENVITIGDAIIEQSAAAIQKVKKSKLKGPNGASRRIAKAIAAKNIKLSQLQKAFTIQQRFGYKRPEWHVVGSYALEELQKLLDSGKPLNEALNTQFERKDK
jgi:hypothetical protein